MAKKKMTHSKYKVTGHKFSQIMKIQKGIRRCAQYFQGMNIFASYKDEEYKACHLAGVHFPVGPIYINRGLHGHDFQTDRFNCGEIKSCKVSRYKSQPGFAQGSYEFDKRHIPNKVKSTKEIEAFLFSKVDKSTFKVIQLIWIDSISGVAKIQSELDRKQLEFEKQEKVAQKKRQSIYLTDKEILSILDKDEYYFADEKTLLDQDECLLSELIEW